MNTNSEAAFTEAFEGQHVAHCKGTQRTEHRVVAIRPNTDGTYNLEFSSHSLGLRESLYNVQSGNARHLVAMFIRGISLVVDRAEDYAESLVLYINQTDRDVEVDLSTLTPTRVRIEYELPNSGLTGAFRHQAIIGDYMFLGSMFRGECYVDSPNGL